jgi:hypothetical protein
MAVRHKFLDQTARRVHREPIGPVITQPRQASSDMAQHFRILRATTLATIAVLTVPAAMAQEAVDYTLPGGTTVDFYGYLKLDAIHDRDYDLGTTFSGLGDIGLPDGPSRGDHDRFQGYETRLGVRLNTPTSHGDLKAVIEADLYGDEPGDPRLRHAYMEYIGVILGKTFTNFMAIETSPPTWDFQGVAGTSFIFTPQLRYTHSFAQGYGASFSVEEDPTDANDQAFTAAVFRDFDRGFAKIAAVRRDYATDELDSAEGWGVLFTGVTDVWEGGTINGGFVTGEGISAYMNFGGRDLDANGEGIRTSGWNIGMNQDVTDRVNVGVQYGHRVYDDYSGADSDATKRLDTVHLSVFYQAMEQLSLGGEYMYGKREDFSGATYRADRFQLGAKWTF